MLGSGREEDGDSGFCPQVPLSKRKGDIIVDGKVMRPSTGRKQEESLS